MFDARRTFSLNTSSQGQALVPAGFTADGLPVTLFFLGPAFSEPRLLALRHGFEQLTRARRLPVHTRALKEDAIRVQ